MTTPDKPLRMEMTFELPGTPEQVWDAIATGNGITAWFMPTDLEERLGGAMCLYMGDDKSEGTITGWEPTRRLEYAEPGWAELTGHDSATVTPMVTEFLVEAKSGGTCILKVVSSAFGTGADWEQEFFIEMENAWRPFFDNLRIYLSDFAGQKVSTLEARAEFADPADRVWQALCDALGAPAVGALVDVRGISGRVDRIGGRDPYPELLLRIDEPVAGYLGFATLDMGDNCVTATMMGYLFGAGAPAYAEREQAGWQTWLEQLAIPAG